MDDLTLAISEYNGRTIMPSPILDERAIRLYLQLFGSTIEFTGRTPERLSGRLILDNDYPDEFEEFTTDPRQSPLSDDSLEIASFLAAHGLIEVDRVTISEDELRNRFCAERANWTPVRFSTAMGELWKFEVPRIENGKQQGAFYLHV